ncbi:MAG: hypothetical protein V1728_05975 [Candidatus Micrarchaeota archaeon]
MMINPKTHSRQDLTLLRSESAILAGMAKDSLNHFKKAMYPKEAKTLALGIYSACDRFEDESTRVYYSFAEGQKKLAALCLRSQETVRGIREMQTSIVLGEMDVKKMVIYRHLITQFEEQNNAMVEAINFVFSIWPPGI